MVSPTDIGRLQIQDIGQQDWGPATEENLKRLEEMIASVAAISTTGGTTTLSTDNYIANQSRRPILHVTGVLVSNAIIQAPAPSSAKRYLVLNGTTGAYTLTVRIGGAGETVAVPQGYMMEVLLDADDAWVAGLPISLTTGRAYATGAVQRDDAVSRSFVEDRVTILRDLGLSAPPGGEVAGDTYFVAGTGSGAWAGHDGEIARYDGASWIFSAVPTEGLIAWVVDEAKLYVSDGGTLVDIVGAGGIADGAVTAAKLASSAVETAKINDLAVTTGKLAANAVTAAKLNSDVFASESVAKTQTSTTVAVAPANVKHAAFPAGTRMIFQQTSAPTGWTKITSSIDNHALRVVTGSVSSGGTVNFDTAFSSKSLSGTVGNTTLTEAQIPEHKHFVAADESGGTTEPSNTNQITDLRSVGVDAQRYQLSGTATAATVGLTGGTGGGGSHTHTLSLNAVDLAVKYLDTIIATKDAP